MDKSEYIKNLENIKLIIGNGFDLYCGLKTSYADFFETKKDACNYFSNIKNNYLCAMSQGVKPTPITTQFEESVWTLYFAIDRSENDRLWSDIETKMINSLKSGKSAESFWNDVYMLLKGAQGISKQNINAVIVADYIKSKKAVGETINGKPYFYRYLLNELILFEKEFGNYIHEQFTDKSPNGEPDCYYNGSASAAVEALCGDNLSSVSSFNYSTFSIKKPYIWINGNWQSPIFGVDSAQFDPDQEEFIFTKVSRRIEQSLVTHKMTDEPYFSNVIIFGHSLSQNDFNYFFPVLDKLEITNSLSDKKIVFAYNIYNKEKREEIIQRQRMGICNLFAEYARYKGFGQSPIRLLDQIASLGKIITYELPSVRLLDEFKKRSGLN